MTSSYQFYQKDDWVEDLQQLVSLDLNSKTIQIDENATVIDTITTSNLTAHTITANTFLQGLTVDAHSNLTWGGHSLYDPYPQDPNDWDDLIPFSGDNEGMIHQSWIRKPLSGKDILTDLWNLADAGIDIGEAVLDAWKPSAAPGGSASNPRRRVSFCFATLS